MPIECCCGNCQYFINDGECSKYDMDVYCFQWCYQHRMDWDKEREAK